ncbi:MAG: prolyl oligopeptidase family serine peptidase [Ignavibacteria bacterium]|jgi:dipeptidyl aminopeptidase/acylaminoacyl peptidase
MKKIFFTLGFLFFSVCLFAQDTSKIPLDHSVYESWNRLVNSNISYDGKLITYEVNPQKGDGWLYIYNTENVSRDSIARGYDAVISPNSDFIAFKIKSPNKIIRELKIKKKKSDQFPKDTLGVYFNKMVFKFPELTSFAVPKENTSIVAFINESKDTKSEKDTTKYSFLNIIYPVSQKNYKHKDVFDYKFSKNGNALGFISNDKNNKKDSNSVSIFDTKKESSTKIFQQKGIIKKLAIDDKGEQIAFLHSKDTNSVKRYGLYYWNSKTNSVKLIADTSTSGMPDGWELSTNESMYFSEDGTKLFFQTAPKISPESKDTIPDDEKCRVDVWNWNDGQLQTQQVHNLEKEKKRTYLALYDVTQSKFIQLADSNIQKVIILNKGNGNIAFGTNEKPYQKLTSWEEATYMDCYSINLETGEKKLIIDKRKYYSDFSPLGNYFLYYEPNDSTYHTYSLKDDKEYIITKSIPTRMYDEEFDEPRDPEQYGIAGWTKDDESVLIYDRYDIWKVNPKDEIPPVNITKIGRDTKTIFRYTKLDEDSLYVPNNILLNARNENTYMEGFYTLDLNSENSLKELVMNDYAYFDVNKSKKSNRITWLRSSYSEYYDLWTSNLDLTNQTKISNANPQQSKYLWGTVEVFKWKDSSGVDQKGLLYKPENFDPAKQYPMIAYFYEKYTDRIHTHYMPAPSRSFINFPLYNSNGYIIFVPDITYKIGYPGKSGYNAVVSGTYALIEKGFVDKYNIGIQGQSWGGYQAAYIITKTNLYKAAMTGAPVANMTSAYGGIRRETGMVRQFQYEQSQTRLGKNLWDGFDLYIENSPLFFVDKIETPVLIMSNDNDGAVPHEQGIEFFTALRRLNKPVWMLTYNGDEHNLVKWPNRVDLAKRTMQYFDYYLKGAPMPVWMSEGVKAIDKGIKSGMDLKK